MARLFRRRRVEEPRMGTGRVLVQTPVVRMLEDHGMTAPDLIGLVRRRRLSFCTRSHIKQDHAARELPHLPSMKGLITWRRAGHYSLDLAPLRVHAGDGIEILFWSCYDRTHAQIRFDNLAVPETLMQTLPGRPLAAVVDHPWFADERIVIRDGSVTVPDPSSPVPAIRDGVAMTSFRIAVPTESFPDQL